jgi:hypothetical protein
MKLEVAAEQGNKEAMLALQFSYTGSKKLWLLDDNTLTIDQLEKHQKKLDEVMARFSIEIDTQEYHRDILKTF